MRKTTELLWTPPKKWTKTGSEYTLECDAIIFANKIHPDYVTRVELNKETNKHYIEYKLRKYFKYGK